MVIDENIRECIDPASDEEELSIREESDTFVKMSSHVSKYHIHVGDYEPLCEEAKLDAEKAKVREWELYPPGHVDLCKNCVQCWREGELDEYQ